MNEGIKGINLPKKGGSHKKKSPLSKKYAGFLNSGRTQPINVIKINRKHVHQEKQTPIIKVHKKTPPKKEKPRKKMSQPKEIKAGTSEGGKTHNSIKRVRSRGKRKSYVQRASTRKRRLHKKYTRNRRISLRCIPKNKKNIENVINASKNLSDKEIKEALFKKGITIKGSNNKLLRDMYLFSEFGGIRIHKN